jgi:hypothetical protein
MPKIMDKNQQVFEEENLVDPITCITNNPGFKAVCLNRWVLEAAWSQYRQYYGDKAHEGPEQSTHRV